MASLDITSALDHTNINNRTAMQIVSSVLKTAKKDGQQVDLNEFVLSRDTIGRRRQENRDTISKQAKQKFLHNMSTRMSLHWDGKMLQDLSGELKEMEAIIVCGENYMSCGTWSPPTPGNCSRSWRFLLTGWPYPLPSGTPTRTSSWSRTCSSSAMPSSWTP